MSAPTNDPAPVEITYRANYLTNFTYADRSYSLVTLYCNCADIAIEIVRPGLADDLQIEYTCKTHGTHSGTAIQQGMPGDRSLHSARADAIFGPAERTARRRARNSGLIAWGMKQSPSSGGMKQSPSSGGMNGRSS